MLVLCGAPLASRAADLAAALMAEGWLVQVAATASASQWIVEEPLRAVVGHAPRTRYRASDPQVPSPQPGLVVVAPLTFNTLNKIAYGIADSFVHTKLCMELSRRTPMITVPVISTNLGFHPILASSLAILRAAGVEFVDPGTGDDYTEPYPPGHDHELAAAFDPGWIVERARRVRA